MSDLSAPRHAGMTALAARHDEIAGLVPGDRRIAYLDYPLGKNVGDLLIMLGTLKFFERHGLKVRLSRTLKNTPPRGRLPIGEGDTIVLQGGGNFGDLYPHIQNYRERIIEEYPDHKVLIFPQTIFFKDKEKLKRSAEKMMRHPDLTFFVRDRASEALARPLFGEKVRLVPDMAHQLWPDLHQRIGSRGEQASNPLFFIRKDEEAGDSFAAIEAHKAQFLDWEDVNYTSLRVWKRVFDELAQLELRLGFSFGLEAAYFNIIRGEVDKVARRMARHDVWITSRLHGFILGLLLGKPVFAIDNSYGKLSSYVETWREDIRDIKLLSGETDAEEAIAFLNKARGLDRHALWQAYSDTCR
ncbi:polysaccharide pyruvyl transferase [Parvibaculum lavamentivorans DS-1]|uniref:Polysaccharide pyruvyl transferase n=1 Tax=Parvibaculum lavamentivorans (strain DS-1 / DSM 13023 / NCIMB 13966) TaxID=402881 RepID=A7HUE7_PARL1|nr:polysaccharide pyruvyl transferase family protein [Parvibaculum lavamentivorans]ABS63530.1 polysaccharide pyruvyl transferase [Parvibaculum lavamentivorans DS-1]